MMRKGTPVKLLRDIGEWELKRGRKDTISLHAGTLGKVTMNTESFVDVLFDGQAMEWSVLHKDVEVL